MEDHLPAALNDPTANVKVVGVPPLDSLKGGNVRPGDQPGTSFFDPTQDQSGPKSADVTDKTIDNDRCIKSLYLSS
jgi:hypothetical protein